MDGRCSFNRQERYEVLQLCIIKNIGWGWKNYFCCKYDLLSVMEKSSALCVRPGTIQNGAEVASPRIAGVFDE
ncbi:MAG: hypothetical protein H7A25_05340 [Leptospiraceae bacterium]|nr:hypothetical protein [Leptospiraceae bacterium]